MAFRPVSRMVEVSMQLVLFVILLQHNDGGEELSKLWTVLQRLAEIVGEMI